jgi:hypothetical protein
MRVAPPRTADILFAIGSIVDGLGGLAQGLLQAAGIETVLTDPGPDLKFDRPSPWDPVLQGLSDATAIAPALLPELKVFKVAVEGSEAAQVITDPAESRVWSLGPAPRGLAIEAELGGIFRRASAS